MGGNQSRSIVQSINATVSKSMSEVVAEQTQIVNPNNIISQSIQYTVAPGANVSCGIFTVQNTGQVTITAQGQFKEEQYALLSAAADGSYEEAITNAIKQDNDGFNLGNFNFDSLLQQVVNLSASISETSITTSMQQTVSPTTTITQSIIFTIQGTLEADSCDLNNTTTIEVSTNYAAQELTKQLIESDAGQELIEELKNNSSQSNTGLTTGEIIGLVFGVIVLIILIAIPIVLANKKKVVKATEGSVKKTKYIFI